MLKVLYVDSDNEFLTLFTKTLISANFDVDSVVDPIEGLELLSKNTYNIVLSELEFDSISGMRFLESVAKIYPNAKRVIITDNENPEFEIVALKEKIDLFLLKKRGSQLALDSIKVLEEEILSKVEMEYHRDNDVYSLLMEKFLIGSDCKLKMNLVNHVVTVDNEIVHLTPKEFEILKLLIENRGQYLSRQLIIDKVWSDSIDKEIRIVDTHIKKIREKTGCFEITTVRGYGYMWRD